MAPPTDLTLVTAADQNYFWGLYLLAASVERGHLGQRLVIFHTGLNPDSARCLHQFSRVELRQFTKTSPFGLHCRKAEAMVEVDGEYIGWLDSDCLVIGDLNECIIPLNGQIQARMRTPQETRADLRRFYQRGETPGGLPRVILDSWRADVGERATPRIDAMVPSNVFIMHARFKPFLEHWDRQIHKVLDPACGTLDARKPAYFLTDESVLNSLLAFADFAPEVAPYRLAAKHHHHIAHFMGSPKPWVRWLPRNLFYLPHVIALLEWLVQQGLEVPPLPPSFQASRQTRSVIEAHVMARWQRAGTISRKLWARLRA
ncbi:MAG: hypothetical protein WCP45_14865 [Verrucomicrobiota bacterium]